MLPGVITSEAGRDSCQLTELSASERRNVERVDKAARSLFVLPTPPLVGQTCRSAADQSYTFKWKSCL